MLDRLATWWLRRRGYFIASPGLARKYELTGPVTPTIRVDWGLAWDPTADDALRRVGLAARELGRKGL